MAHARNVAYRWEVAYAWDATQTWMNAWAFSSKPSVVCLDSWVPSGTRLFSRSRLLRRFARLQQTPNSLPTFLSLALSVAYSNVPDIHLRSGWTDIQPLFYNPVPCKLIPETGHFNGIIHISSTRHYTVGFNGCSFSSPSSISLPVIQPYNIQRQYLHSASWFYRQQLTHGWS